MTHVEGETLADIEMRYILEWAKNPRPAPAPVQLPTIHHTELWEDTSGGPFSTGWNYFRREIPRLLAEGHDGEWAGVMGEEVLGFWATREEAVAACRVRYPGRPVLIQSVRERYQVARVRWQYLLWD